MIKKEKQLWDKISQFKFDDEQENFNFSDRLARENNWTISYSKKVIEEYKKFIFLCCNTKNGVTPSDQVDQAWHLHLTYTRSYWTDFCKNTLEKEIHHNPTKGGNSEAEKFDDYYTKTNEAYIEAFKTEPPIEIWPNNENRFSDINFKRVNIDQNWIIKKPSLRARRIISQISLPIIGLIFIQASSSNYQDLILGIFLIVVVIILIVNNDGNSKGGKKNDSGCSTGCDIGHSGCSSHGCSSGCSGCGGD
jgi:hypothetical protein